MNYETVEAMWKDFLKTLNAKEAESAQYEAWPFGDSPELANELSKLVKNGKKTATCSLHYLYEIDHEPLPQVGHYNVITDWEGKPEVITLTTKIEVIPFNEVTEEFAYKEGEGDRSYDYWKDAHIRFFNRELQSLGKTFKEDMLVVCEEFEVVFPK